MITEQRHTSRSLLHSKVDSKEQDQAVNSQRCAVIVIALVMSFFVVVVQVFCVLANIVHVGPT